MLEVVIILLHAFRLLLTSPKTLVLENLILRQQLSVYARQQVKPKVRNVDRLIIMAITKLWDGWRDAQALLVVQPATLLHWHRAGFRRYWTWRSKRRPPGRPRIQAEIKRLVRQMANDNLGWGAPRIHGELLKLGFTVSEATVSKLMPRKRRGTPGSQNWTTFLRNHLGSTAAIDLFTVHTATFKLLYVCVVLCCERRRIAHISVTSHPTPAWAAQCVVEAFPEDSAPRYLVRDRDGLFDATFTRRVVGMGIEELVTAPQSPWQNAYVERVIGSIRHECLDHVIVFNEQHLRRLLSAYLDYYHTSRTHLALAKDAPLRRQTQRIEQGPTIVAQPLVGGLHHRYQRRDAA